MITRRRRRSRRVERGRESDDGDNGGSHASELVLDSTIKVLTAARQCDGDDTSVIEALRPLRPAKVTKRRTKLAVRFAARAEAATLWLL